MELHFFHKIMPNLFEKKFHLITTMTITCSSVCIRTDLLAKRNCISCDCLCGLVVRVLGYRSGGLGPIPGTTRKKKSLVCLERGPLSLVSTTEELLDRKVAVPV
jgi:hypothetical protein